MANVSDNLGAVPLTGLHIPPVPGSTVAGEQASLLDDPFMPQVVEVCRTCFPGDVSVEVVADPSEPSNAWLSFKVNSNADFASILKNERKWHERVFEMTGDRQQRYRLFVVPRE